MTFISEPELKEYYKMVSEFPLVALWDTLEELDRTRYSGTYFDAEANQLETEAVRQCLLPFNN